MLIGILLQALNGSLLYDIAKGSGLLLVFAFFLRYFMAEQKEERAKNEAQRAKYEAEREAQRAKYEADMKELRRVYDDKIEAMNRRIDDLNSRMLGALSDVKTGYENLTDAISSLPEKLKLK